MVPDDDIDFRAERKRQRDRLQDGKSGLLRLRDRVFPSEFGRLYAEVKPYSMMSYARLRGIYEAIVSLTRRGVPGVFVECGTARGGCATLMRLAARARGADRELWVYDTFEGLPMPTEDDPDYELAKERVGACRGEYDDVRHLFESKGVLEGTTMIRGLFQDTVPRTKPEGIALLHLDGDWYESTRVCLDHLYDLVAPGGIIQVDDYGHWAGARKALEEFFAERGIQVGLRYLDYTGRQFTKP